MQEIAADWNDFRLILAVSRAGSLTGAARALGIDHSTAYRRLQAQENRLGFLLFERLPGGRYVPTEAGRRAALAAERMEEEALALAREIEGRDAQLTGTLKVTSSETLAYRLLTSEIARFRLQHPGITVELTVENRLLSLARREADVALRAARPHEGDLWGRKLADLAWTVYGRRDVLAATGTPGSIDDLAGHPVIAWGSEAQGINAAEWLAQHLPAESIVYRSSSLINQLVAVRAGMGLAALPCYIGDAEPELARALPDLVPELSRELWMVTHADLRRTARVAAFFATVGEGIAAARPLLEGKRPAA